MSRLIIVITGANSGVGFATSKRLLLQLSQTNPPDVQPQFDTPHDPNMPSQPFVSGQSLTLIMACRNVKKAEAARQQLYQFLDTQLELRKTHPNYDSFGDDFRKNLKIEIECVDLALFSSVIKCSKSLHEKYPYISHLICNAGGASFYGVNFLVAVPHVIRHPIVGVTLPQFNLQSSGERSFDGLGWVWQSNVFCHYVLYREIQDLLASYSQHSNSYRPARVLWTSSLESVHYYDPEDWQLLKTEHSYEASKYQMDLIGTQLGIQATAAQKSSKIPANIRHFVVQPGVANTGMIDLLIVAFMKYFMLIAFYIARYLGSPHHVIDPLKAAISIVHVSLAPIQDLPSGRRFSKSLRYFDVDSASLMKNVFAVSKVDWTPYAQHVDVDAPLPPIRFGSQCDRSGKEYVGITRVKQWKEYEDESKDLVEKCEKLYQTFLAEDGQPPEVETFRGMS